MGKVSFRELRVWQKSKELAVLVYQITGSEQFSRDFGLRDQLRRSAVSIPSNIAEGNERDTDKDSVRFFYIARGSAAELLTQSMIASEIGYLAATVYDDLEQRCLEISRMLARLIASRSRPSL
jgi:four helix bundle protein